LKLGQQVAQVLANHLHVIEKVATTIQSLQSSTRAAALNGVLRR